MGKQAPSPPDPKETAAASTGSNINTAISNAYLNNYDQVTPDGSLTYETTGYETVQDPYTGQSYQIPKRTATQTLSETQQGIKDQTDSAKLGLGQTANTLIGNAQAGLSQPFEFNNQDAENWAYDLASPRLLAQQGQNDAALRTTLANKGIREGSAAWNSEMARMTQGNSDQMNQLALNGRGQAFNEQLTGRNQTLNELTALLSGSQVQQPNYVNPTSSPVANTDVAGLINNNYQQQLSQWQQNQGVMGGLMGGIGTLLGAPSTSIVGKMIGLSDKRAKKDIKKVGEVNGMGLYDFKYKGTEKPQRGLMAQDVEKKMPSAVHTGRDGFKRVDYGKALGLMGV